MKNCRICNKRKIAWSPGCGSVTEIGRAHELGSVVVEDFSRSQVGGRIRGGSQRPDAYASIMPTGGVSPMRLT
jgi:2-dehydro-3-deoxyphosphogluconate aldolase/(4S)-4-hydroxy-2-oxoglutarate aldolase